MRTLREESSGYDQITQKKINHAEKMDEVDVVTFGLRTDDEKVVLVYVDSTKEKEFQQKASELLGEIDSIEDVLNKIAQDDPSIIIDVDWPEADGEKDTKDDVDFSAELDGNLDADDEDSDYDDGSSALNQDVVNNKNAEADQDHSIGRQKNMSVGDKLRSKIMGESIKPLIEKQEKPAEDKSNARSLLKFLPTPQQKLCYQVIKELGIPESVLTSGINRAAILDGIKAAAEKLEGEPTKYSILRTFAKKGVAEAEEAKGQLLTEALSRDDFKGIIDSMIKITDRDYPNLKPANPAARVLNSLPYQTLFSRLQTSQLMKLQPATTQLSLLAGKLKQIEMNLQKKAQTTIAAQPVLEAEEQLKGGLEWEVAEKNGAYEFKSNEGDIISVDLETLEMILKSLSTRKPAFFDDYESSRKYIFTPQAGGKSAIIRVKNSDVSYAFSKEDIENAQSLLMSGGKEE